MSTIDIQNTRPNFWAAQFLMYIVFLLKPGGVSRVHRRVIRGDCRGIGSPTAFLCTNRIPHMKARMMKKS